MRRKQVKFFWVLLPIILCSCYYPQHNPDNIEPPVVITDQGTFPAPPIEADTKPFETESDLNMPDNNKGQDKMQSDFVLSPYIPHAYFDIYYSSEHNWQDRIYLLAPLYTNNERSFFLYGQWRWVEGQGSDNNTWTATTGLGYRQVFNSQIYGAYILLDYNDLPSGSDKYWVISPGIESIGNRFEFRANGYFPLTKTFTSSYLENPVASGNQILADQYDITEQTGNGVDSEVGVKLFSIAHMPFKAFVDGYYFNMEKQDADIGIGGRVTFQPTRYLTLEFKDVYDNYQHNVFLGGVKISFNNMVYGFANNHVDDQDVQTHLYDPIERSFAVINGGTSTPVITSAPTFVGQVVQEDHDVFVVEGDGSNPALTGSGTAEDPYVYNDGMMQPVLDQANSQFSDYSHIVFAPGDYYIGGTSGSAQLYGGQNIRGAEADFVTPASADQVTFYGGLVIGLSSGGYTYDLENFTLYNDDDQPQGIAVSNSTLFLNNVVIGVDATGSTGYATGIAAVNSNLNLNGTSVYGFNDNTDGTGAGIEVIDGGYIAAGDSTTVIGTADNGSDARGVGILVDADASGQAIIGNISGDSTVIFGGSSSSGGGYGLLAKTNGGSVYVGNIQNVVFSGSTNGLDAEASVGIKILNIDNTEFAGDNTAFYVSATTATLSLGHIENSFFYAGMTGIYLNATIIQVDGVTYPLTDSETLFKDLSDTEEGSNDFNLTENAVCLGAFCAP